MQNNKQKSKKGLPFNFFRIFCKAERDLDAYQLICDCVGTVFWEMDIINGSSVDQDNIVVWSHSFKQMLGFEDEDNFPDYLSSWSNRLHPDEKEDILTAFAAFIDKGSAPLNIEYKLMQKNGEYGYYRMCCTTQKNRKGSPVKVLSAIVNIDDKHHLDNMIIDRAELLVKKQRIQNSLNDIGSALVVSNKNTLNKSLVKGMSVIGKTLKADRVQIWRNEVVGRDLHFSLSDEWLSDYGKQLESNSKCFTYPYNTVPGWEEKLKRGKYINSPIVNLLPHECAFFSRQNVKTLLVIPLFKNDNFWGFLRIDDCQTERLYTDEEMIEVTTAGQIMAFALVISENQNTNNYIIDKTAELTHWYTSILGAIPVPVSITDADMNLVYINTAAESMVGKKSENIVGNHCSVLGLDICNTPECGIACAKRYINRIYYKSSGKSYQIDVAKLQNLSGKLSGFVEIIQNIT